MTNVRADRASLRSPVRLDDGTVRYDAILTTAGTELRYSWGTETVHADALADPAYLDALDGLSILFDPSLHWDGIDVNENGDVIAGTVTSPRFANPEQVASLAIKRADVVNWIDRNKDNPRGTPGVSVRYDVLPEHLRDGVQMRRTKPNHVLLTLTPRDTTARIRADQENTMELAELAAKVDALGTALAGLDGKIDGIATNTQPRADQADPPNVRARVAAVDKIARVKGIDLDDDADLAACEAKVVEALGLRADAVTDAGAYLVGVASVIPDESPDTKRADGFHGRQVTTTTQDDGAAGDLLSQI